MSAVDRGVTRIVGVYNADGSVLGELRYLVGRTRGTTHCELCDVTHGRLRKKPAFAELQEQFTLPIEVVHRDERTAELAAFTAGLEPCVVGETPRGYLMLLTAEDLRECGGDVGRFEARLRAALATRSERLDPPNL
jgi:hypothetical protein